MPNTTVSKVTLFQLVLYFTCAPLLLLLNDTSHILTGWAIVLITNLGTFLVTSFQKPSARAILSSELFKYVAFSLMVYASIQLQPNIWPQALYGILVGQLVYVASCMTLGKIYA